LRACGLDSLEGEVAGGEAKPMGGAARHGGGQNSGAGEVSGRVGFAARAHRE
jgi:hypothetical protein